MRGLTIGVLFASFIFHPSPALAARQQVYVSGTVQSFGSYTFTPAFAFTIRQLGVQELGAITVEGLYNGDYPWIMRIYTENTHHTGVAGMLRRQSAAGLVSTDGAYAIPIEVHCPAFGPDEWRRVPDLFDEPYLPYHPSDDPAEGGEFTDCIIMGIDPRHAPWVAGPDGKLFTADDNVLGDATIPTPFEITVRASVDAAAVHGSYDALLYIEIVPAP